MASGKAFHAAQSSLNPMAQRGRISEQFINDLVSRADIVDVIEEFVPLKRRGNSYKACCPFHQEKTPSFTVDRDKQFYHCFGCGVGGNIIRFLMEYQNLSFVETIESLADRYGMTVPRSGASPAQTERSKKHTEDLFKALEKAALFYQDALSRSSTAKNYLRSRQIDPATTLDFMIGYAPHGRNTLATQLAKDFDVRLLELAGLVVIKGRTCYDRFFNRLMFPIRDRRGRVIAFGGRALDESALAKYLNSPETPLFQKRRELYGVLEASTIKSSNEVWVVEGYMDVVSLASHGMRNCVATLGTAATAYHISSLFRMSDKIIFCFDGDAAGQRAALAASTVLLPLFKDGKDVRFFSLPENQDPDDLVKEQGPSAFDSNQAVPLSRFVLQNLAAGVSLENLEGRTQLVARAKKLLHPLPKTIFKNFLTEELAKKAGLPAAELAIRPSPRALMQASPQKSSRQHQYNSARVAITYLLHKPSGVKDALEPAVIAKTGIKGTRLLAEIVSTIKSRQPASTGALLQLLSDHKHYQRLLVLLDEKAPTRDEFGDSMKALENHVQTTRLDALIKKAEAAELSLEEKKTLQELIKKR